MIATGFRVPSTEVRASIGMILPTPFVLHGIKFSSLAAGRNEFESAAWVGTELRLENGEYETEMEKAGSGLNSAHHPTDSSAFNVWAASILPGD